jgi:hypothetical protein
MHDPVFYSKPLTFKEKAHRYYWGGEPVPSVTTIIGRLNKPLLIQWAANCAVDHIKKAMVDNWPSQPQLETWEQLCDEARKAHATIRDTAGDIGKEVHEYARRHFMRMKFPALPPASEPEHPQARNALAAFRDWVGQHHIEPIGVERRVFSKQRMYAGTCDFYGCIDGRLAVLDFKTGNGVYDEAWYQMAGYEMALQEELETNERPQHWLVHLNKNTGECWAYEREPEETESAMMVWGCLVDLDKCIRQMPKPKRKAA